MKSRIELTKKEIKEVFPDYPCEGCSYCKENDCKFSLNSCFKWNEWFGKNWEQIRKVFGKENGNEEKEMSDVQPLQT